MNNLIKGDEVRHGKKIYFGALSKAVIADLSDESLSESLLTILHDGHELIFPKSAQTIAQSMKAEGEMVFAICLKDSHVCIGIAQLHNISWQARYADLKIAIFEDRHYISATIEDVIQTMLQFIYWEANLNRVSIQCVEDNTVLQQAIEASGFTDEGRLRQEIYRHGRYLDVIVYSILAREWIHNPSVISE